MAGERVWALVDVDAMYASVEKVFRPDLHRRPVVVLSNNDGCVVARDKHAKALGIAMGQPWFQLRTTPRCQVVACSSNYELYGDFSARMLAILEQHTPWIEPYSIDEAFLHLPVQQAEQTARQIRAHVDRWLGIPVSVGIATTKTLAKVAARQAKTSPAGVYDLTQTSAAQQQKLLESLPTTDIWGIGARLGARLAAHGILTAGQLARTDPGWARRAYTVTVERTIRELTGTPCLPLDANPPPRRQLIHCRLLGHPLTSQTDVADTASAFAQSIATKLRKHHQATTAVSVWLTTGGDFYTGPHLTQQATQTLLAPTNNTITLARTAAQMARRLWRPGYTYRRIGICLPDLIPEHHHTGLWESDNAEALTTALDTITTRYGHKAIGLGRTGLQQTPPWAMHQHHLSPAYTTRWKQLPTAY